MNHLEWTDFEFEQRFSTGNIEASAFSHEAHLRLAWIHIHKYGIERAIENVCVQLKQFVKLLGVSDKYNETVTIGAVKAVHHFMLRSETANFVDFIVENPALKNNFKALLSSHYATNIFQSEKAKKEFLQPELAPFD